MVIKENVSGKIENREESGEKSKDMIMTSARKMLGSRNQYLKKIKTNEAHL